MPRQERSRPARQAQQRKQHRKTTSGCANCRFRRVKCDEQKPYCHKCQSYGVLCSYTSAAMNMSTLGEQINVELSINRSTQHVDQPCSSAASPTDNALMLIHQDARYEMIHRFQHRTVVSLGSPELGKYYAAGLPKLALERPYLMHTILALTLLHDRAMTGNPQPTTTEAYHLGSAAALFNEKLSRIEVGQDKDAIWATAVYLCAATVFNVETQDPHQAWPLSDPSIRDLEWLRLQNGLRTLWEVVKAMGDSVGVFATLDRRAEANCVDPEAPQPGINQVPQILVRLYHLDPQSTTENNDYHAAVRHLSALLHVEGSQPNILQFMVFAGGITKTFKQLLDGKDPRALLLLGIWYCKILRSSWWMIPRAHVECHAICIYLKRLDIKDIDFTRTLEMLCQAFFRADFDLAAALTQDEEKALPSFRPDLSGDPPNKPTSVSVDMFWV